MHEPIDSPSDRLTRRHVASGFLGLAFVLLLAGCAAAGAGPSPTPEPTVRPTPTPVAVTVASKEDAAALVVASNPVFAGATELNPEMIGASKWWTATPLASGGYQVEITVGWGDCMAGCIDKHTWTYEVSPDGQLTLIGEVGPEVPSDLPA